MLSSDSSCSGRATERRRDHTNPSRRPDKTASQQIVSIRSNLAACVIQKQAELDREGHEAFQWHTRIRRCLRWNLDMGLRVAQWPGMNSSDHAKQYQSMSSQL